MSLPRPTSRDVGREWKPREVVSGKKPFAGKVSVTVEIRLGDVAGLGEEFKLRLGFLTEPLGTFLVGSGA